MMRRETPKIPKLRLDLLLYTNMGAEALAKYQSGNQTVESWHQRQTSERNKRHWMGAHSNSPRMNITTAPAGRQGTRRRRRVEGSEKVAGVE